MADEAQRRFTVRRRRVPGAPGVPGPAGRDFTDYEVREGDAVRVRAPERTWADRVCELLNAHGGPA